MTHDVPARRSAIWERRGSQDASVVAADGRWFSSAALLFAGNAKST